MKKKENGIVVWITGLSGSGKTTLARRISEKLMALGSRSIVLDGDEMRRGLCSDLGFTLPDRAENVRRIAETAAILNKAGLATIVALISPTREGRRKAREIVGPDHFIEVWCRCPLEVCEKRDPKNLYRQARCGALAEFTGITSIYENPENPQLIVDTERLSPEESATILLNCLQKQGGLGLP